MRHKETLTLFLREYFELFFPDLAKIMQFETAVFLDKELIALLFGEDGKPPDDHYEITDALILIQIHLDGKPEWILIHWEQQSEREKDFEKRMFHYFCGIYFKHEKLVFPIAMFTDSAKWRKPVKNEFSLSLTQYPICEFTYHLIKLKNFGADEFEEKIGENPLAAAYLPLTDYPKKDRPVIKARAMKGIAGISEGRKRATLFSLIQESIRLDSEEERQFRELVRTSPMYKEVKMLESVEEVGYERGMEEARGMLESVEEVGYERGMEEAQKKLQSAKEEGQKMLQSALEETAMKMLDSGVLTHEQIAQFTGLDIGKIRKLAKSLAPERRIH